MKQSWLQWLHARVISVNTQKKDEWVTTTKNGHQATRVHFYCKLLPNLPCTVLGNQDLRGTANNLVFARNCSSDFVLSRPDGESSCRSVNISRGGDIRTYQKCKFCNSVFMSVISIKITGHNHLKRMLANWYRNFLW